MFRFRATYTCNLMFVAAVGVTTLLSSGCREEALERAPGAADGGGHAAGLTPEQAALVLAKVGDQTITLGEFAATLERMDQFDRLRYKTPERRRELLEEMITVELLAREAERRGLDKEPQTQEALRQILRDSILRDARKKARSPAAFSEKEVRAYYESHKDQFLEPERRRVSHLVVSDKKKAEKLLEDAKKANTPQLWGKLVLESSEEFAGKEYKGPVETAGDLGLVGPPGERRGANPRVPEEVRRAAFGVSKAGDLVDGVVEDSKGAFHLVRVIGINKAHARSFSEAERTIRILMSQQEVAAREKELEAELRQKFPVTVDDKALAEAELPKPNPPKNRLPMPPGRQPPKPPKPPGGGHGHDHAH